MQPPPVGGTCSIDLVTLTLPLEQQEVSVMPLFSKLNRTILSLVFVVLLVGLSPQAPAETEVIHQLRIYQLFDNTKEAFHERFRDHAQRIMARHDFHIVAM